MLRLPDFHYELHEKTKQRLVVLISLEPIKQKLIQLNFTLCQAHFGFDSANVSLNRQKPCQHLCQGVIKLLVQKLLNCLVI